MPEPASVQKLLHDLFGRQVRIQAAAATPFENPATLAAAEYVGDDGRAMAAWICDRPLSCWFGAALSMMAPNAAHAALQEAVLPDTLEENLREVLNITVRLFMDHGYPHLRMSEVHWSAEGLSPDFSHLLASPTQRSDLMIEIEGYGRGHLVMLAGNTGAPEAAEPLPSAVSSAPPVSEPAG